MGVFLITPIIYLYQNADKKEPFWDRLTISIMSGTKSDLPPKRDKFLYSMDINKKGDRWRLKLVVFQVEADSPQSPRPLQAESSPLYISSFYHRLIALTFI